MARKSPLTLRFGSTNLSLVVLHGAAWQTAARLRRRSRLDQVARHLACSITYVSANRTLGWHNWRLHGKGFEEDFDHVSQVVYREQFDGRHVVLLGHSDGATFANAVAHLLKPIGVVSYAGEAKRIGIPARKWGVLVIANQRDRTPPGRNVMQVADAYRQRGFRVTTHFPYGRHWWTPSANTVIEEFCRRELERQR